MAYEKKAKSQKITDKNNVDLGKIPPQAIDLEEAVLGAIMLEKDAFDAVIEVIKVDSFYVEAHQKIFKAIIELSRLEQPIDILTVSQQLKKENVLEEVGGPAFLAQLSRRVVSGAHAEFHARIIAQKYIQRELIRASSEIQRRSFEESEDVQELLEFAEMELFNIAEGNIKKQTQQLGPLINEAIRRIQDAGKKEDGLSGVGSGFTMIDRITGGWQPSDLIIIAARPSMGKTAFVLSMARNMAVNFKNQGVAVFSLEMSSIQLVNRLIIAETELASDKIRSGKLAAHEWIQLDNKIMELTKASIFVDDTPAISIFELRAKCRRLLKKYPNIKAIIIDYLQLMTAGGDNRNGNREQEVSIISRSLKALAKELDIPIIALSQLNRSVETRSGNKRPQLSDLRESGAIEQDADVVVFIHRPEYYGFEADDNGLSLKGIAEIIIAKHRNGPIGDVKLKFKKELAKFIDMEEFQYGNDVFTRQSRINEDDNNKNQSSANDFLSAPYSDENNFLNKQPF